MKAALLRAVDTPLEIDEIEIDEPGPTEVSIEVLAAGLCHSDLRFIEGAFNHPLPAVLGHESAGVVKAVGKDVDYVAPGDHVVTSLSVSCGSCGPCAASKPHLCVDKESTQRGAGDRARLSRQGAPVHQFLNLSSFAEEMLVHETAVVKVPAALDLEKAALLGCGVATGLGAVFNTAGVEGGESVAVIGCGGVGLSAVQGARIAGAAPIVAVDSVAEKLDLARSLGATHAVDASRRDPVAGVREATGGRGVDHAIEAIGSAETALQAFAMTSRGGTATIIGLIPGGEIIPVPADLLYHERTLQGSVMGSNDPRVDIPRYIDMLVDGRIDLDSMVTRRLSLDDINDGFEVMRSGRGVRSLVIFA